jgi:GntR family transcriptional regulator
VPLHFVESAHQVEDSLYAALEVAGFCPVRALQRLRAIIIGPAEAALLKVAEGSAVKVAEGSAALDIQRIAYLVDGRCVEFTRSVYRSDTFDFVSELTLSPNSRRRIEGSTQ